MHIPQTWYTSSSLLCVKVSSLFSRVPLRVLCCASSWCRVSLGAPSLQFLPLTKHSLFIVLTSLHHSTQHQHIYCAKPAHDLRAPPRDRRAALPRERHRRTLKSRRPRRTAPTTTTQHHSPLSPKDQLLLCLITTPRQLHLHRRPHCDRNNGGGCRIEAAARNGRHSYGGCGQD